MKVRGCSGNIRKSVMYSSSMALMSPRAGVRTVKGAGTEKISWLNDMSNTICGTLLAASTLKDLPHFWHFALQEPGNDDMDLSQKGQILEKVTHMDARSFVDFVSPFLSVIEVGHFSQSTSISVLGFTIVSPEDTIN